jgi:hypothetical protein
MKVMCGYDSDWNALDKFLDRRTELLGYGVACICDLCTNRNQNVRTAFNQAQRCEAICLERSTVRTSSAVNRVPIMLTSTNSTASQILSRIFAATYNPSTVANFKRSTPVKRTLWPMLAAIPIQRAPPIASIARYKAWVSVRLAERNRRTERVRAYPSACSMGFVRLRFRLFHQVDEGALAPSPSKFRSPTPTWNASGHDGVRVVKENWDGALVAGVAAPPREAREEAAAVVGL